MSHAMRRAGVLLAKASTTSTTISSLTASATTTTATTTTAAAASRKAVSREETSTALPAQSSTTESLMPWDGWLGRFLQSQLGDSYYKPFRDFWTFRPDDIHNLEQIPRPSTQIPLTPDGKLTAMYRYPSPGSQTKVNLPTYDKGDIREDPYNVLYYPTDTRRMDDDRALPSPEVERAKLALLEEDAHHHTNSSDDNNNNNNDVRMKEAQEALAKGPGSSPGNKGRFATGISNYDPTGLRSTMSANHESMNLELQKHLPDHLPTYSWASKEDDIIAWHEERGLPLPIGGAGKDFGGTYVPTEGRIARW